MSPITILGFKEDAERATHHHGVGCFLFYLIGILSGEVTWFNLCPLACGELLPSICRQWRRSMKGAMFPG